MATENTANLSAPDTIVLIHGLWMTPLSWEHRIVRYGARGFRVLAPARPRTDGDIDGLRRDPSGIGRLGIREITGHYAAIIRGLDPPPIVMGHSFSGAFTQILLDQSDARIRQAGPGADEGRLGVPPAEAALAGVAAQPVHPDAAPHALEGAYRRRCPEGGQRDRAQGLPADPPARRSPPGRRRRLGRWSLGATTRPGLRQG
jgi:hypothetical protein